MQVTKLACIVCQESNSSSILIFCKNCNNLMGQYMENFTLFQYNKKSVQTHFLFWLLIFFSLLLCSCSAISGTARYVADSTGEFIAPRGDRADFDLDNGIRFYKQAGLYTGEIVTRVHPTVNSSHKPTALFVPLGLVQNSRDHEAVSKGVSRLVYESFLAEKTFAALEYNGYVIPYHVEDMLPVARQKGAEYLVGGVINQYFDGGATGDSRFAMQLYIYQVDSGDLMWSLHHSGVLPYKADSQFGLFTVKNRMPVNPMSTLISVVGGELARLIHYWTDPKEMRQKEMEEHDKSFSGYTDPEAF